MYVDINGICNGNIDVNGIMIMQFWKKKMLIQNILFEGGGGIHVGVWRLLFEYFRYGFLLGFVGLEIILCR